ncbi:hypothetical protein WA026_013353 [Henosepilachna vigintioctopunctata]
MFHLAVISSSLMLITEMVTISNTYFWTSLIRDIVFPFIIGVVMFMMVEYPCTQLQKMFLPQVKMMKHQSKERTNDVGDSKRK